MQELADVEALKREKRNADIDDLLRRLQEPDFAKSWA